MVKSNLRAELEKFYPEILLHGKLLEKSEKTNKNNKDKTWVSYDEDTWVTFDRYQKLQIIKRKFYPYTSFYSILQSPIRTQVNTTETPHT